MFYQVRFQTGELAEVVKELKNGEIPCMDVVDMDEFFWVTNKLEEFGVILDRTANLDRNARDGVAEPEFEFRATFYSKGSIESKYFIDFYFEPYVEEEYASVYGD